MIPIVSAAHRPSSSTAADAGPASALESAAVTNALTTYASPAVSCRACGGKIALLRFTSRRADADTDSVARIAICPWCAVVAIVRSRQPSGSSDAGLPEATLGARSRDG